MTQEERTKALIEIAKRNPQVLNLSPYEPEKVATPSSSFWWDNRGVVGQGNKMKT